MYKIGSYTNKNTNKSYIVIAMITGKAERIEFYTSQEDVNIVDTTLSVCAYYRSTKEYVYGEPSIVSSYLGTINKCLSFKGETNIRHSITKEGIFSIEDKINEKLQLRCSTTLKSGIISCEEYETEDAIIKLDVTGDRYEFNFIYPLNIDKYEQISILDGFGDEAYGEAEYYSLEYLKATYDIDHIESYNYIVVSSLEEAKHWLQVWRDSPATIKAYDTESTGLDVSIFGEDVLTGVVMSYDWEQTNEPEISIYFPFRQDEFEYNLPIEFVKDIADAINAQPKNVELVGHNIKMEYKTFKREGFDVKFTADTYPLSCLIDTYQERGLHTLKNRAYEATQLFWLSLEDIFKDKIIRFNVLPKEIVRYYACPDASNNIKVYKYLLKKLPKEEIPVWRLESKLQRCKFINEYYGLRLNQEGLESRLENVEYVCDMLSSLFKKTHNTSANINSADVLRNIIYNKLGCPVIVKTKKGKPSTSVDAISDIVARGVIRNVDLEHDVPEDIKDLYGKSIIEGKDLKSNKYPSLVVLSVYNKYKKELGALRRLKKKSNLNRVMFGINGTGAASGRQTSDAHQYSDSMKELVIADTPEHSLISCDYSQVELRVLAYYLNDPELIKMMSNKFNDIHRIFLSAITGIPIHMISAKMRKEGKQVNFGVVYGISGYGLARNKYGASYTQEELNECMKAITDFFNGIPAIKDLIAYNRKFVFEHGYIEDKFKYRRNFPKVLSGAVMDKKEQESIFRAANNTPIQGFAAHLMKLAEVNFDNYIREHGWDKEIEYMDQKFPMVRVMLSIHDEVLISAHNSIPKEEIVIMCQKCMEIDVKGAPPFYAVPALVDNWYCGKCDEYEMSIAMRDEIVEAWNNGHKSIVDWDNFTACMKEYKHKQISEYMDSLIRKYKTEEEVAAHVNHNEFTHTLISLYLTKKEYSVLTHEECIKLATSKYMSGVDIDAITTRTGYEEYEENKQIQEMYIIYNGLEKYLEVDDKGNVKDYILNENLDDEDEDAESPLDRLFYSEQKATYNEAESTVVLYLGDVCLVDVSDFEDRDELRDFIRDVYKICSKDGYYKLHFTSNGVVKRTDFKISYKQKEIIESYKKHCKVVNSNVIS